MIDALAPEMDAAGQAFLSWYETNVLEHPTWERAMHPETLTPEEETAIIDRASQILKARIASKR